MKPQGDALRWSGYAGFVLFYVLLSGETAGWVLAHNKQIKRANRYGF